MSQDSCEHKLEYNSNSWSVSSLGSLCASTDIEGGTTKNKNWTTKTQILVVIV